MCKGPRAGDRSASLLHLTAPLGGKPAWEVGEGGRREPF